MWINLPLQNIHICNARAHIHANAATKQVKEGLRFTEGLSKVY